MFCMNKYAWSWVGNRICEANCEQYALYRYKSTRWMGIGQITIFQPAQNTIIYTEFFSRRCFCFLLFHHLFKVLSVLGFFSLQLNCLIYKYSKRTEETYRNTTAKVGICLLFVMWKHDEIMPLATTKTFCKFLQTYYALKCINPQFKQWNRAVFTSYRSTQDMPVARL